MSRGIADCGAKRSRAALLAALFTAPVDADGDRVADRPGGGARVARVTSATETSHGLDATVVVGGRTLQQAQVALGQARVTAGPEARALRRSQQRARAAGRGVWKTCGGRFHRPSLFDAADFRAPLGGLGNVAPRRFIQARANHGGTALNVYFVAGLAPPCYQLDRVEVEYLPDRVAVTVFLGQTRPAQQCEFVGKLAAVPVTLAEPLAGRPVVDGAR
jgi:hypothetical protein